MFETTPLLGVLVLLVGVPTALATYADATSDTAGNDSRAAVPWSLLVLLVPLAGVALYLFLGRERDANVSMSGWYGRLTDSFVALLAVGVVLAALALTSALYPLAVGGFWLAFFGLLGRLSGFEARLSDVLLAAVVATGHYLGFALFVSQRDTFAAARPFAGALCVLLVVLFVQRVVPKPVFERAD